MGVSGINISSPSIAATNCEADYSKKVLSFVFKLQEVQQGASKLIVNFKSEHLSDSDKTSFIKETAPLLDKLANGMALVGAAKFSLQGNTYKNSEAYSQSLNSMAREVKANYDELKTLSNTCAASLPADSRWAAVTDQESNASKTDAGKEKKSVGFTWWTKK